MTVGRTPANTETAEVYAHKFFVPTGHAGSIARESILQQVFSSDDFRLVVLQGPAGHGKTTTLQQLKSACAARGYTTAWLSLDDADNDPRRFWIHIQALIATLRGDSIDESTLDEDGILSTRRRRRTDWIVDRLFKLDRPCAVFLDDFQTLHDRNILSFCRELFEHIPANVIFFVGSRSLPDIGLAKLQVSNQALIIYAAELRFSEAEARRFFVDSKDLAVNHDEISTIYKRTEGWPAALQLFRLSLASPSVRNSLGDVAEYRPRELAEYLADSVLTLQPARTQEFLLRTSLLTRLSGPLCDAVTGWHHSQEVLLHLERSGLFVRGIDSNMHWFIYHALFSSFLSEHLQATAPDICIEVHRRAAAWHLKHSHYEEAVYHAVEGKDFSVAADTLNIWADRLIAGAHLMTAERWYDKLPFDEVKKRPDLTIKIAYALVFLRRRQKLDAIQGLLSSRQPFADVMKSTDPDIVQSMAAICVDDLPTAFAIIERVQVRHRAATGFSAFELGAASNLLGYRAMISGDFDGAREYLAMARAYGTRGDASFSGGYSVGVLGVNLLLQGQLPAALSLFRESFSDRDTRIDNSFASAAMVSCYIWALYEANELDRVESLFGQHQDIISESVLPDFLAAAYMSMANTQDARGCSGKALEVLDEAESISYANGWTRITEVLNWARVRRALLIDGSERAVSMAAHIERSPSLLPPRWMCFSEATAGAPLSLIRLDIHALELKAASSRLTHEMSLHRGGTYHHMKLLQLDSLLQHKRGAENAASRSLRKALQLGASGGYVRAFLDEGEPMLRLLRDEYHSILENSRDDDGNADRGFIERLLQASGTDFSRIVHGCETRQPIEALTDREKEILVFFGARRLQQGDGQSQSRFGKHHQVSS